MRTENKKIIEVLNICIEKIEKRLGNPGNEELSYIAGMLTAIGKVLEEEEEEKKEILKVL